MVGECAASIDWYDRKKWSKSLLGFLLRLGAILMVGVGGLIPLIGELLKRNGIPGISPAWATVALALAALLIAIDRFGGYTSGWIRYIRTAQSLTRLKGEFLMDWQEHRRVPFAENQRIRIAPGKASFSASSFCAGCMNRCVWRPISGRRIFSRLCRP